jgi:hypothetical protein
MLKSVNIGGSGGVGIEGCALALAMRRDVKTVKRMMARVLIGIFLVQGQGRPRLRD